MSALATISPSDDLTEVLSRLPQIERFIAQSTNADDMRSAVDQARLLRELKRIRGLAEQVAAMALRIEVLALRRLSELGAAFTKTTDKRCADRLARTPMADIEVLLASTDCPRTALGVSDRLGAIERQQAARRDVRSGRVEPDQHPTSNTVPWYELAEAAAKILNSATTLGTEFTVADAADKLLAEVGAEHSDLHAMAARELIRDAIAADDGDSDGFRDTIPAVVTFRKWNPDGTDGAWVRIPWRNATLAQLRWMAEYRMVQAKAMLAAAERLTDLVDSLAQFTAGRDESNLLLPDIHAPKVGEAA